MKHYLLWSIVFLLIVSTAFGQAGHAPGQYTYEKAEALKPTIDWRDYGPEAFAESVDQNKPIFLLLTAPSWCYWCQVYESEDFLFHPLMVSYVNENTIPIYVDADQRKDLTRKYLEGGWPSTTVMTPSRERLYGYSGPRPVPNMLENLQRSVTFVNAQGFSQALGAQYVAEEPIILTASQMQNYYQGFGSHVLNSYDSEFGGFGSGQKFPQGRALDLALDLYDQTGQQPWLDLVENTLEHQYTDISELEDNYNLYDPVEGGFHRYGTTRQWDPPHYEKMLYDNARLLKVYAHLLEIDPDNELAQEVVRGTDEYMQSYYYDEKYGGFFGNTDVHGEDHYYGQNPRPADKPRVEPTKYTDWNVDAILTYLYLWQQTGNERYEEIARTSLDFYLEHMLTDQGTYHYVLDDEKGVQGSIVDNAYLFLGFVEAYDILGDEKYLDASQQLATYLLDHLYDWNSGGFFERNSPNPELYAPGEHIDFSKPGEENGILSYAFGKLAVKTENALYASVSIKTLGRIYQHAGGLDRGYYSAIAARYITQYNLHQLYDINEAAVDAIELSYQENFWASAYAVGTDVDSFEETTEGVETLQAPFFLLIVLAILAGLLSFLSPCTLPILPAFVAYSLQSKKENLKIRLVLFLLGLTTVFAVLGMTISTVGQFLRDNLTAFSTLAGIVVIFLGVLTLFGASFKGLALTKKKPVTAFGSYLFGGAFAISWTPCSGPILVALLVLASVTSSMLQGGILLFFYSVGLALPLLFATLYLDRRRQSKVWKLIEGRTFSFSLLGQSYTVHSSNLIAGILFIVLGILITTGTLFTFNSLVSTSSVQTWLYGIEELLLGLVS